MDQWIREGTRQVDEPRRGIISTSTHLWLLTVRHSNSHSDDGSSNKNNKCRLYLYKFI